ncbi:Myb/SANT-like domain [Macleaya cordata]|uniref:Myb/SANT-like domain n=1 Tax=Macleaya cordata TaxID=56857 RepID=A0A200QDR8_MACCD|nr:Myb/SANT-like domain [Macleaya cordata]
MSDGEQEQQQQQEVVKGKRKNDTWTMEESNELLQLLVDACQRGWRNTSGIIPKQTIEQKILPQLNAKLQQQTNDNSGSLYTYAFNSGFGWDNISKKFKAIDEVWTNFIQSHPGLAYLRTDTIADYEDLRIVIGNLAAIGRSSFSIGTDTDAPLYGVEEQRRFVIEDLDFDDQSGTFKATEHESLNKATTGQPLTQGADTWVPSECTQRKKRIRIENGVVGSSSYNTSSQNQLLEQLCLDVHNMSNKFDAIVEKRGALWDAMKEVPRLDMETRFRAMKFVVGRETKEMFVGMSPEEHYEWTKFQMKDDFYLWDN